MPRVVVQSFGVSLDGFGAGPDQDLQNPLGVNGPDMMGWFFPTRTFRSMQGMPGGETGTVLVEPLGPQSRAWLAMRRPQ